MMLLIMNFLNIRSSWKASPVLRYLVIGSWNTFFSAALIYLLLFLFNNKYYEFDVALAFALSTGQSYMTQRMIVWKSTRVAHSEFLRFVTGAVAQYLFTSTLLFIGVHRFQLKPKIIVLPILITIAIGFYFINQKIVFKIDEIEQTG
jgi:hypothetical protein